MHSDDDGAVKTGEGWKHSPEEGPREFPVVSERSAQPAVGVVEHEHGHKSFAVDGGEHLLDYLQRLGRRSVDGLRRSRLLCQLGAHVRSHPAATEA